jgi:hypothetical protein
VWFYPCSYIRNCLKMPKKSQINEYSDTSSRSLLVRVQQELRASILRSCSLSVMVHMAAWMNGSWGDVMYESQPSNFFLRALQTWDWGPIICGKCQDRTTSHCTRAWGPQWPTRKFERISKPTWSPTWHAMDNVLWSIGFCVKPISKRWV